MFPDDYDSGSVVVLFLLLDLLHHLHTQGVLILDHLDWLLLLLLLILLFDGPLLQLARLFTLGLLLSLLLIELLLVDHVLLLQLLVLGKQELPHILVVIALELDRSRLHGRAGDCEFFTALLCHFFCVDI